MRRAKPYTGHASEIFCKTFGKKSPEYRDHRCLIYAFNSEPRSEAGKMRYRKKHSTIEHDQ